MNLRHDLPQTDSRVRKRTAAKMYLVIVILLILLGVLNRILYRQHSVNPKISGTV